MSKQSMHADYKHYCDTRAGGTVKSVSYPHWCFLWRKHFDYVAIPDHQAFSVCTICAQIHDRLLRSTKQHDDAMIQRLAKIRIKHINHVHEERLKYAEHQMKARLYPEKYACVVIDGMDQAKLCLPHFHGGAFPKGPDIIQSLSELELHLKILFK